MKLNFGKQLDDVEFWPTDLMEFELWQMTDEDKSFA